MISYTKIKKKLNKKFFNLSFLFEKIQYENPLNKSLKYIFFLFSLIYYYYLLLSYIFIS